ncbi:hypothetical protein CRYUN_Cryun38cG0021600 [Craigia yunnanensis]
MFRKFKQKNFHAQLTDEQVLWNHSSTFGQGCQLKNLNLNGNQLEGPLPRSIMNCTSMEVSDLGNNKIRDVFPHWLGSLPQLQFLVLKSNQLHGYGSAFYTYSIHLEEKGNDRELQKIFTMLTSIDFSNNEFQGEIPEVIGRLNSLKGLNLSHNNLSGHIPPSVGNLTNLEWLDLSSNKLVGKIPEKLVDLTSLSVLNLSENQLDGPIPQGKQFNTFENIHTKETMGYADYNSLKFAAIMSHNNC